MADRVEFLNYTFLWPSDYFALLSIFCKSILEIFVALYHLTFTDKAYYVILDI